MEFLQKRFSRSKKVVGRMIDDEVVIVPVSADLAAQDYIYNLDPAGSAIWQMIDGRKTVKDIRDAMVRTMEVPVDVAASDLAEFLEDLKAAGAIEEA